MSLPFRTYAELLDRIEALCGKDTFTANEQARILSLVNARLYSAYRRCDYWTRYLVVGEPRLATDNVVPYSQASAVLVSGAGDTELNGIYQPIGTINGETAYYLNGDTDSYYIYFDSSAWIVASSTVDYYATTATGLENPWNGTYTEASYSGTAPAPIVTESTRADVDKFFRLYTGQVYGSGANGYELEFYTGNDGAHTTNTQTTWDQLYCTYKRVWDGPYAAASDEIPLEFFEFAAYGASADFLRSNGNFNDAQSYEAEANDLLNFEMMTKQMQYNANIYAPMFKTYISNQRRYF